MKNLLMLLLLFVGLVGCAPPEDLASVEQPLPDYVGTKCATGSGTPSCPENIPGNMYGPYNMMYVIDAGTSSLPWPGSCQPYDPWPSHPTSGAQTDCNVGMGGVQHPKCVACNAFCNGIVLPACTGYGLAATCTSSEAGGCYTGYPHVYQPVCMDGTLAERTCTS